MMITISGWYWIGWLIAGLVLLGLFLVAFNSDRVVSWFVKRVVEIEIMYAEEKAFREKSDDYFTGDEDL